MYGVTTNPASATGDGKVLALEAGAELEDIEMFQFHPTAMVWPPSCRGILVTEGVRGEGEILLNVKAKTITDEMCVAAAKAIAEFAEEKWLREDYVVPTMEEWEVYPREAVACALEAIRQGVARVKPSREELSERAVTIIKQARESPDVLMKAGLIKPPPREEGILTARKP
jgi:succinate dehydrogenase/fumarate reductase flavoprotein subunit